MAAPLSALEPHPADAERPRVAHHDGLWGRLCARGGGELSLLGGPALGEGIYATVLAAVHFPARPAGPPELWAVKKPSLRLWRERAPALATPGVDHDRWAREAVLDNAQGELVLALRALSGAAPQAWWRVGDQPYLLMAPMQDTLSGLMEALAPTTRAWSPWGGYVLAELLPQLLRAHARGVVHMDLSLTNVLWRGRHLHLADFGLACEVEGSSRGLRHGTAWCAAPEALEAEVADEAVELDMPALAAAECFSLGVLALVVGAGQDGQHLYGMLVRGTQGRGATPAKRAYRHGWTAWYHGSPPPLTAAGSGPLLRQFSRAMERLAPELQRPLRQLLHPEPSRRASEALSLTPTTRWLSAAARRRIDRALDALAEQAGDQLAEALADEVTVACCAPPGQRAA